MKQSPPTYLPIKRKHENEQGTNNSPKLKKSPLAQYRLEFEMLKIEKKEWLTDQRRSSLLVKVRRIDDDGIMAKFAPLYQTVSCIATEPDEHAAHLQLIEDIVKESIIIEWPRQICGGADEMFEVDQAPLIHRARNVVKCRTSHPTMRIKVYAMVSANDPAQYTNWNKTSPPALAEAFFRCTLTKAIGESAETRAVAGKMILTQREGTAAAKTLSDKAGATVTEEGKLVASQAATTTHQYILLVNFGEPPAKTRTTPFKYENGVLCATFPEMGVMLNSMVDRRQLATRYAIQLEVGLNIDNKLLVNHTLQSHPFLIAITNDQTEPLLNAIIWSRLLDKEHFDGTEPQTSVRWGVLGPAVQNFVKSQLSQARSLTEKELLHFQAMLFLIRVSKCRSVKELMEVERGLFTSIRNERHEDSLEDPVVRGKRILKERLLSEEVDPSVTIEKAEFMGEHCVALIDGATELRHSPWQWLFKATEMILDVGHKLCPSPAIAEKKSNKTKKQLAAAEEYHTMYSLFNKGIVSFSSIEDVIDAYGALKDDQKKSTMMIRFCDENASHFSFSYGVEDGRVLCGSASADALKDLKQGLSEALMDETKPSEYNYLMKLVLNGDKSDKTYFTSLKKRSLFNTYQSLRLADEKVNVMDDAVTTRINPLTGQKRIIRNGRPQHMELDSSKPSSTQTSPSSPVSNRQSPTSSPQRAKEEVEEEPIEMSRAVNPFDMVPPLTSFTSPPSLPFTSLPEFSTSGLTPDFTRFFLESLNSSTSLPPSNIPKSMTAPTTKSRRREKTSSKDSGFLSIAPSSTSEEILVSPCTESLGSTTDMLLSSTFEHQ